MQGSDPFLIGLGRARHCVTASAHIPSVDAVVSAAARTENTGRVTSQPTDGRSSMS